MLQKYKQRETERDHSTEKKILLHIHVGIGDIRMRIINGRPLARCNARVNYDTGYLPFHNLQ
jgi:hypothetical protein